MTEKEINIKDCDIFESRYDVVKYIEEFQIKTLVVKTDPPQMNWDNDYELSVYPPNENGWVTAKIPTVYVAIFAALSALNALDWERFRFVIDNNYSESWILISIFAKKYHNREKGARVGLIHLTVADVDEFWVEEEDGPWSVISPFFYQSFGIEYEPEDVEDDYFLTRFGNNA